MATSSIFAQLTCETAEEAERLVRVLEQAVADMTPPIKVNYINLTGKEFADMYYKSLGNGHDFSDFEESEVADGQKTT